MSFLFLRFDFRYGKTAFFNESAYFFCFFSVVRSDLFAVKRDGDALLEAYGDAKAAAGMAVMLRHSYLAFREDRDDAYLFQFPTNYAAPSRIIWDISTIAFLKNPGWTTSTLETAPVFNDNLTWGAKDESRHQIRVVNFCNRDCIFGDMIACLTK